MSIRNVYSRHCSWCNSKVKNKSDYVYHRYLCWKLEDRHRSVLRGDVRKVSNKTIPNNQINCKERAVSPYPRRSRSCSRSNPSKRTRRSVSRTSSKRLLKLSHSMTRDNKENTYRAQRRSASVSRIYEDDSEVKNRANLVDDSVNTKRGFLRRSESMLSLDSLCKSSSKGNRQWAVPDLTCYYDCECRKCHSSCSNGRYLSQFYREQHCRAGCLCVVCHIPSEEVEEEGYVSSQCGDSHSGPEDESFSSSECDVQYKSPVVDPSASPSVSRRMRRKKKEPYYCRPCRINLYSWDAIRKHIMSIDHLRISKWGTESLSLDVGCPSINDAQCTEQLSPRSTCSERITWDDVDATSSPKDHLMASLSLMRIDSVDNESADVQDSTFDSEQTTNYKNPSPHQSGSPSVYMDEGSPLATKLTANSYNNKNKIISRSSSTIFPPSLLYSSPTTSVQNGTRTLLNNSNNGDSLLSRCSSEPSYWLSSWLKRSVSPRRKSRNCLTVDDYRRRRRKRRKYKNCVDIVKYSHGVYNVRTVDVNELPRVYVSLGKRCDADGTFDGMVCDRTRNSEWRRNSVSSDSDCTSDNERLSSRCGHSNRNGYESPLLSRDGGTPKRKSSTILVRVDYEKRVKNRDSTEGKLDGIGYDVRVAESNEDIPETYLNLEDPTSPREILRMKFPNLRCGGDTLSRSSEGNHLQAVNGENRISKMIRFTYNKGETRVAGAQSDVGAVKRSASDVISAQDSSSGSNGANCGGSPAEGSSGEAPLGAVIVDTEQCAEGKDETVRVIDAKSFLDRLVAKINENSLLCTSCMQPFDTNDLLKQLFP